MRNGVDGGLVMVLSNLFPERDMKDLLVIHYSRTGTARTVAETLAHLGEGHIGQILDERPRNGLAGDVRCIVDQLMHRAPAVRYSGPNPNRFRHIVLVAPVWMRRLASPMTSFLRGNRLPTVKIACVTVMAREGGFTAMQELSDLLPSPLSADLVLLQQQVMNGEAMPRLTRFIDEFLADDAVAAQRQAELSPNAT